MTNVLTTLILLIVTLWHVMAVAMFGAVTVGAWRSRHYDERSVAMVLPGAVLTLVGVVWTWYVVASMVRWLAG